MEVRESSPSAQHPPRELAVGVESDRIPVGVEDDAIGCSSQAPSVVLSPSVRDVVISPPMHNGALNYSLTDGPGSHSVAPSPSLMAADPAVCDVGVCRATEGRDGITGTVTFCGAIDPRGLYRRRLDEGHLGNMSRAAAALPCGAWCDMYMGPHASVFTASNLMILVPTVVFVGVTRSGAGAVVAMLLLVIVALWALWRTASSDPGVLHRGPPLPDTVATPRAVDVVLDHPAVGSDRGGAAAIRHLPIPLQRRWCFTCNILRPLRASHCEFCGVCVERRDHHCPWTGTCIGRRNYPYFVLFICLTSLALLACVTASLVSLIGRTKALLPTEPPVPAPSSIAPPSPTTAASSSAWERLDRASAETYHMELLLILYTSVMLAFVGSLAVYHLNLARRNLTTREDLRKEFKRGILITEESVALYNATHQDQPQLPSIPDRVAAVVYNPYDQGGWWANMKAVLVAPVAEELSSYAREVAAASGHLRKEDRHRLRQGSDDNTAAARPITLNVSLGVRAVALVDRVLCCFDRFGGGVPDEDDAMEDRGQAAREHSPRTSSPQSSV